MLLPLLNTEITSSFSQGMRNTDPVYFLCLRIFMNLLEINKSPSTRLTSLSSQCMLCISVRSGTVLMGGESKLSLNEKWV